MNKFLFALGAILILVLALFLVAISRLDSEALGREAIELIRRQTGIDLQAKSITLHPLQGLTLEDETGSAVTQAGSVHATVQKLRIEHRLLPLLWGEVVMDEVVLQGPVIELVSRPAQRPKLDKAERRERRRRSKGDDDRTAAEESGIEGGADSGERLRLSIENLRIEEGAFSSRTLESEAPQLSLADIDLELQGLEFDSEATGGTRASGRGRFSSGPIVYGDFEAFQSSGRMELADGIARLSAFEVQAENAELVVDDLAIQLSTDPPKYTLTASGGLDFNGILGASEGDGFGPVAIDFVAKGKGPELAAMAGDGTLRLQAGSLPGFPAMVQIEELLGRSLLTGRKYQAATITYELSDSKLLIAPFELIGDGGRVGGAGHVDLGGTLDLDVFVRLPRESLDVGVLDSDHLANLEDDEGMVKIPFTLYGSFDDPKVGMEWSGMKELIRGAGRSWAERALEEAAEKAREWLAEQSEDDGQ